MTSVNYREVKRKAAVGERIKIVAATDTYGNYADGDVYEVTKVDRDNDVWFIGRKGSPFLANPGEYVVLEPVTATATPLQSDPLYAAFRQLIIDNADAIRAILPELEAEVKPLRLTPFVTPALALYPPKVTRAQVIAKATADVAELLARNYPFGLGYSPSVYFSHKDGYRRTDECNFVINREKRTVVALISVIGLERIDRKGIAKCSPADVFHAEICKAIALRKALGLTVPSEYTDAPQPEKAEVGAVVSTLKGGADWNAVLVRRHTAKDSAGHGQAWGHSHDSGWIGVDQFDVIDDTDVDYSAAEAKEAA